MPDETSAEQTAEALPAKVAVVAVTNELAPVVTFAGVLTPEPVAATFIVEAPPPATGIFPL